MTELILTIVFAALVGAAVAPLWRAFKHVLRREVHKRIAANRPYKRTNGLLRRKMNKQKLRDEIAALEPIEPPTGTAPEAAARFRKLSPLSQRQAVAARRQLLGQT